MITEEKIPDTLLPESPFISAQQIKRYLGVSDPTVYKLLGRGEIPSYRLGKGLYRVAKEDFEEWLRSSKIKPKGAAPKT